MTDTVKVRALRIHHGDQGTKQEGDVYDTSPQHAKQLGKLVEIVDEKAAVAPDNKSDQAPPNKAEPRPDNKTKGHAKSAA